MTTLYLTRGLPASGKSTWARWFAATYPDVIRANRDDFRQMLFGKPVLDGAGEQAVTIAQHGVIDAGLKAGKDVVVDDTNLNNKFVRVLMKIAQKHYANVQFIDFTDVPLEECLRRDAIRREEGNSNLSQAVGEKVIRDMHSRYIKGRTLPLPTPVMDRLEVIPYVADTTRPSAIVVDIDGTLAKMNGRSPYDWHRVGEDSPVQAVIAAVRSAYVYGDAVIIMSGRDAVCRSATEEWLNTYLYGYWQELHMRPEGDNRKDDIIKYELFDIFVRNQYNVKYVLDDRQQVVDMWRKLGLNCFQVAPGDF